MNWPRLKKKQGGFTIVELLLVIVVGSILVLSINTILTSHAYLSQRGRDLILANAYAELKMESLRSIGFLGLTDGTTEITNELPSELSNSRNGTLVISSFSPSVKQVLITITYNEQGKSRTYSYKSYIGELGVGQY